MRKPSWAILFPLPHLFRGAFALPRRRSDESTAVNDVNERLEMLDKRVSMFLQVIDSGSITKAARLQYLSKVSVKAQMDSLENEIGVKLLERTTRGVKPTAAGRIFYEGASKMAYLADRTLSKTRSINSSEKSTVRIGTSVLRPCRKLLELWDSLEADRPDIAIEIVPFEDDTTSLNQVVDDIGHGIDCFVAPCDSDRWRATTSILLLDELPFCLAVPRSHPLAKRDLITWDDLDGETIMMVPGTDSPIVGIMRREIKEHHPEISIVTAPVHYDITTFNACEQSGYLLPTYPVWADAHPSLKTVPVDWPYRMPFGLIYSKQPTEAMASFANVIKMHNQ